MGPTSIFRKIFLKVCIGKMFSFKIWQELNFELFLTLVGFSRIKPFPGTKREFRLQINPYV